MAELLIHSHDVPLAARAALTSALAAPSDQRRDGLHAAARILHLETGLPCEDVRELVGLSDDCECDS